MDDDLQKELAEMGGWGTDAPSSEPPIDEEEVNTEPPVEEEEVETEAPGTEAPGTAAPGTEAPSTEAPDELQLARDELERTLREKAESEEAVESKEETPPKVETPSTDPPFDPEADIDFLGDQDLDEVTSDPRVFNALLNKVYKAGVGAGTKLGSEKVLRSIPEIVKKNIQAQTSLQKARDKFFEDNKDLQPYPMVVAESFNKAVNDHPDYTMEKLLEETETLARQRLNLHRKVMVEKSRVSKNRPKFEKTPSGKKGEPKKKLSGLAKEIDDMIRATE